MINQVLKVTFFYVGVEVQRFEKINGVCVCVQVHVCTRAGWKIQRAKDYKLLTEENVCNIPL